MGEEFFQFFFKIIRRCSHQIKMPTLNGIKFFCLIKINQPVILIITIRKHENLIPFEIVKNG